MDGRRLVDKADVADLGLLVGSLIYLENTIGTGEVP